MSDDLVQRLRDGANGADMEAADRIEELEAALRLSLSVLNNEDAHTGLAPTGKAVRRALTAVLNRMSGELEMENDQ